MTVSPSYTTGNRFSSSSTTKVPGAGTIAPVEVVVGLAVFAAAVVGAALLGSGGGVGRKSSLVCRDVPLEVVEEVVELMARDMFSETMR